MPLAPSRPCKHPMCPALVPAGQGAYCPAHRRADPRHLHAQLADRARGSAASRGYDSRWHAARLAFLAKYPLCPGVLIPTEHWTHDLAMKFHALREQERAAGHLLFLSTEFKHRDHGGHGAMSRTSGVSASSVLIFLEQFPIYRHEPWDIARPATIVDHIVPHKGDPILMWAEWNWQPLTKRAHDKKTAREEKAPRIGNSE